MKSLLLIRHAKSSWAFDVDDFDRPLNQRGEQDAPDMARRLQQKNIVLDGILSSPAKRAITTATHFATVHNIPPDGIVQIPTLYEPTMQAFASALATVNNQHNTIALFSHNPCITEFANSLTATTKIDDMPTCSIFAVQADIDSWKDFAVAEKTFWFFDYPKGK